VTDRWRRGLRLVVGRGLRRAIEIGVVALVVEFVLLPQFAGSRGSFHQLLALNSPWLLGVVGAEALSLTSFALATRAMLPAEVRPGVLRLIRIDLSTIALSHGVPGGGAAGTALGLRLLHEAGVPLKDAAFAKVGQGFGAAVVLQGLLLSALGITIATGRGSRLLASMVVAGVLIVLVVGALVALLRLGRDRLAAAGGRLTRVVPFLEDELGHRIVMSTGASLDAVLSDPRRLATAAAWSAANWLLDAVALWCAIRAYGHTLSYLELMVPFGVASTLAWIPVTPGGLGFVEGALVPLLVGFGTPQATAVLGVITWRLVAFWLPIPLGALAYVSLTTFRRGRPATAAVGDGSGDGSAVPRERSQ
jgi:uncharacterized protein (TIRG00374 family)